MALFTSECGATRFPGRPIALITSGSCEPTQAAASLALKAEIVVTDESQAEVRNGLQLHSLWRTPTAAVG